MVGLSAHYGIIAPDPCTGEGKASEILKGPSCKIGKSLREGGVGSVVDVGPDVDRLKVEGLGGNSAEAVVN